MDDKKTAAQVLFREANTASIWGGVALYSNPSDLRPASRR